MFCSGQFAGAEDCDAPNHVLLLAHFLLAPAHGVCGLGGSQFGIEAMT
jgi:hypothetical protein